jgi:ubiquinone/menaquinone biosynthesis C-methylase UbiE
VTLCLNLASGTDLRDAPWVNLDVVRRWPMNSRNCDVVWDARTDRIPCGDKTVDHVYAGYLLLHLAPRYHAAVLAEILRVLVPGGRLEMREVDMAKTMARWLTDPFDPCAELIWGEMGTVHGDALAEFDKHCHGFTRESLMTTLIGAGFRDVASPTKTDVWYDLWAEAIK